jgi:hypothetical protein
LPAIPADFSLKTWAGHGSAQNAVPGFFLGALNDNDNEAAMTKAPKGRRYADPRQADFLALLEGLSADFLPVPAPAEASAGQIDMGQQMRLLLNRAINESALNRDQIAERLTAATGHRVTKAMLDSWTGASRPHRFPAEMIPAMCGVLGNTIILEGIAEAAQCHVVDREQMLLLWYGKVFLILRHAVLDGPDAMAKLWSMFGRRRHG